MTLSHCWGNPDDIYKLVHATNTPKSSTFQDLLAGIPRSILPRTFQNAIQVTRLLGTRYLWIDSLCIVQDSTEDWQLESAQMGKVYSNGILNIAATGSADGAGGLLGQRLRQLPLEMTAYYVLSSWKDHNNSNLLIHRVGRPHKLLLDGPLLSRGWVIQERIMARRILHFGKNMLYWECNERDCCEIYRTGIPEGWKPPNYRAFFSQNVPNIVLNHGSNLGFGSTANSKTSILQTTPDLFEAAADLRRTPSEPYQSASTAGPISTLGQWQELGFVNANSFQARDILKGFMSREQVRGFWNGTESQKRALDCWNSVVSDYSHCELTFEKDKLVALAGVARAMKAHLGCDYLAGIWRIELERNLLWSAVSQCIRPKKYRAPSWSWASIDGVICINERMPWLKHEEVEIEILSVSTQKKSADEMGQVVGGALTVRGPLMTCFVQKTEDFEILPHEISETYPEYNLEDLPAHCLRLNRVWSAWAAQPDAHEPFDIPSQTELHCLPIQKCYSGLGNYYNCLHLEGTTNRGEFRRYGTLELDFASHHIEVEVWKEVHDEEVIVNEEWFGGGEADSEGRYTITII